MSRRSPIESACFNGDSVALDENKALVRRLIDEAVNERNPDVVDELADSELATAAKRWIGPFRTSFPNFTMQVEADVRQPLAYRVVSVVSAALQDAQRRESSRIRERAEGGLFAHSDHELSARNGNVSPENGDMSSHK